MSWVFLISARARERRAQRARQRETVWPRLEHLDKGSLSSLQVWSANDMQMSANECTPTLQKTLAKFLKPCAIIGQGLTKKRKSLVKIGEGGWTRVVMQTVSRLLRHISNVVDWYLDDFWQSSFSRVKPSHLFWVNILHQPPHLWKLKSSVFAVIFSSRWDADVQSDTNP